MRIHRPTLYVGLGGTGCRVGAELERGLREHFPPDQLPSRVQFLYADLNENDLPARPHPPSRLFDRIVGLAAGELDLAESGQYREFWAETLPGALRLPFRGVRNPLQDNLHDLREWVAREPERLARP
ncbi:tubulin-like protein [Lentzea atacamensis]|uniref:Tubulin-like protein n=1 Tax=Lentzea atacamensis TaxID=531938 RepID=A0ABX9E7X2_9PSEU|nr:tubulin-like doman-containing protein [Lentzea atacamensis]RAS65788.1 tubulin-like protein [Lentzea atacamensis]